MGLGEVLTWLFDSLQNGAQRVERQYADRIRKMSDEEIERALERTEGRIYEMVYAEAERRRLV